MHLHEYFLILAEGCDSMIYQPTYFQKRISQPPSVHPLQKQILRGMDLRMMCGLVLSLQLELQHPEGIVSKSCASIYK